jgi:hypothetical protein
LFLENEKFLYFFRIPNRAFLELHHNNYSWNHNPAPYILSQGVVLKDGSQ